MTCQFNHVLLVHGWEDVEISGWKQETPDDKDALQDEDHVAEVVEEADGDVDAEAEQEVAAAEDAERARRLEGGRDELDLERKHWREKGLQRIQIQTQNWHHDFYPKDIFPTA